MVSYTDVNKAKDAIRDHIIKRVGLSPDSIVNINCHYNNKGQSSYRYSIDVPKLDGSVAGFTLYSFPGCCKYGVLSQMTTNGRLRGIGLCSRMLELAYLTAAVEYEWSTLIGTTAVDLNDEMADIAEAKGWTEIHEGYNPNSDRRVRMWSKELPEVKRNDDDDDYYDDFDDDDGEW